MNEFLAVLIGFLLRLGVPLLATIGLVWLLGKLDRRWQAEAQQTRSHPIGTYNQQPCWEQKGCSLEQMSKCPATNADVPCWQVFRKSNGYLKEACLTCEVFRAAPVPAHPTL